MQAPDSWITRYIDLIPAGGTVLDVAAGGGRHSSLALKLGHPVVAVDRDCSQLKTMSASHLEVVEADLEQGFWPFEGRGFDGIIICNYLWRPLMPDVLRSLSPGGVLLWTTFASGNERFGRPRNPDFLLQPNELLEAVTPDLEVIRFEHGECAGPQPSVRQSICAMRPGVDRDGSR